MKELSNPILTPREKAIIKAYAMAIGGNASILVSSIEDQRVNATQLDENGIVENLNSDKLPLTTTSVDIK